jgi:hypothetical protein
MPVVVAWIVNALRILFLSRVGLWIASALAWLGINWGSVKLVIEPAANLLKGYINGLGSGGGGEFAATAMQYAGLLNLDRAVTMIVSAYITKHAVMQGRLFLFRKGVGAPA